MVWPITGRRILFGRKGTSQWPVCERSTKTKIRAAYIRFSFLVLQFEWGGSSWSGFEKVTATTRVRPQPAAAAQAALSKCPLARRSCPPGPTCVVSVARITDKLRPAMVPCWQPRRCWRPCHLSSSKARHRHTGPRRWTAHALPTPSCRTDR